MNFSKDCNGMDVKEPDKTLLSSIDFSPEKYVRDLSQHCVGGPELRRLRKKIQNLSEETNNSLKKNVYQNYMQFIDSAKELSHLESEMYQLSHLLSEQKSLLTSLCTTSILADDSMIIRRSENKDENVKEQNQINHEKLASILEKVEGCKELLEVSARTYLYEGPLAELDPLENTVIKNVQAYLFSDGLMIATRNGRGLMKYVFETMYELGSLAVVNVKDLGNIKYAFKILIFPDTRIFKCDSETTKKEWLEKFDHAKKTKLTQDQQKRESVPEKSPSRSISIDSQSLNQFEELEDTVTAHPEWFLEAPEELDVCIAQRHFDDALALLQRVVEYCAHAQQDHVLIEVQRKVDVRHNNLTQVLMKELEISTGKSMQGGLGASRRAVRLLIMLGHSNQACDLFLKLCTYLLKIQYDRTKKEGSITVYVKNLSGIIFTNICHMTEEFLKNFPNSSACCSAYLVWVSAQLSYFSNHFIKRVFKSPISLSNLAECIDLVRWHCQKLCTYGVDLCYQVEGALRTYITKALKDFNDKFVESIKFKALDDNWNPTNLKSKNLLSKCLNEYAEMGLILNSYITGDVWLQITANNMEFSKTFLILLNNCLKLETTELLYAINDTISNVFEAQIKQHELILSEGTKADQKTFVIKNAEFLLTTLMVLCQRKYIEKLGFPCEKLKQIQDKYSSLITVISPTTRDIKTKYSSDQYL
ncbi:hypothetical protein WA026_001127 [Henosepilachna vigintioctopunctata]|uniref:Exocyst complex component 8 n=1 Tax=Henosepilachna vigintioctopunctata TaxID=420089 RepID=A0AAW1V7E2_9CUCU